MYDVIFKKNKYKNYNFIKIRHFITYMRVVASQQYHGNREEATKQVTVSMGIVTSYAVPISTYFSLFP